MGSEQSVQASGRLVCRGGVLVSSDGKTFRQVVDVKKDVIYTNHDLSSMSVMMTSDVLSAVNQLGTGLSCVEVLARDSRLTQSSGNTIAYKK